MKVRRKTLWQILVPSSDNAGNDIPLNVHKEWDEHICRIAGGMTILRREKGRWVDATGETNAEPMIPVLIACDQETMFKVAFVTKQHYKQESVFFHKVSEEAYVI